MVALVIFILHGESPQSKPKSVRGSVGWASILPGGSRSVTVSYFRAFKSESISILTRQNSK